MKLNYSFNFRFRVVGDWKISFKWKKNNEYFSLIQLFSGDFILTTYYSPEKILRLAEKVGIARALSTSAKYSVSPSFQPPVFNSLAAVHKSEKSSIKCKFDGSFSNKIFKQLEKKLAEDTCLEDVVNLYSNRFSNAGFSKVMRSVNFISVEKIFLLSEVEYFEESETVSVLRI